MNSIPLVKNNSVNDINTSLIALRKVLRELTETTSDVNKEIEKYVLKSDVVNVVESDNNSPVTSGAVYSAIDTEASNRNTAITNAIDALDVAPIGSLGKYIIAIEEVNGKINAAAGDIDTTVASGSNNPVTSGGVADALSGKVNTSDVTSSIIRNSTALITSGSVYEAKYRYIFRSSLSSIGWYKIAELSIRNYGCVCNIDLCSSYVNSQQGSHHIELVYGWVDANITDLAKDTNVVFSGIRLCWNANNNQNMAIYIKYNKTAQNGVYANVNACTDVGAYTPYNFETDTKTWDSTIEYNLGSDGFYINGNLVSTTRSLPETKGGDEETEEEKPIEEEPKEEER